VVNPADVDADRSVRRRRVEHVPETCAPDDLIAAIRRSRVDSLRESLVETVEQNEELRLALAKVIAGVVVAKRAILIDRMHDRPRQREEGDFLALELQRNEFALAVRAAFFPPREEHPGLKIDDLRAPLI